MKITDTHYYFWEGAFSNWYACSFNDPNDKNAFSNTEQAFMYHKARIFKDADIMAKILKTSDPKAVKELGRQIKNYNDELWSKLRYEVMVYVNYLKFRENAALRQMLVNTGNKVLVEASPYDKIWGVGLGEDDPLILDEKNWQGENLLGKALMEVRVMLNA